MSEKRPIYLSDEYRNSIGRLLDLTEEQKKKIKKKLRKEIKAWKENSAGLHRNLERWNDLLEGVVDETEWPFPGASNVHIPLIAIYCKVYHSIERRSILGSDLIWYVETEEDELRDATPQVEEAINYKARNVWNITSAISDVFWTTNRDGLGILQVSYMEEFEENVQDVVIITSIQDFADEFPTPQDANMDEAEWNQMQQHVLDNASPETPVEIPITYDKEIYRGPYGEVVELADFVTFPSTAISISQQHCTGYGKRFYLRKGQIKKKGKEGVWYQDAVNNFIAKKKSGSKVSSYQQSKDDIDGLKRSERSDEDEFFELVYRCELESGEGEKKLLLVYSEEEDELMATIQYPYRVDFMALFRIEKRPNRLIGSSIPKELEDLNEEVDALHNQRVNSRKIAEVPSFKGKKGAQSDFDPNAEENLWRPGVIFWLQDPDSFEQFKVQPVDLNSSMAEEKNDIQISSLNVGVEPFLFSGNPTQLNPDAPGNKTYLLIQQSNLRMDDPISELREGVEQVGEICLSMEYQFGDPLISYVAGADGNMQPQTRTFSKRVLRKGLKMRMHGVTVALNPEAEFQKWINYAMTLAQFPMVGNRIQSLWELLRNALRSGRVPGREKILPPLEQLQMEQQQMMQQQNQQADAEQAVRDEQIKAAASKAQMDHMKNAVTEHGLRAKMVKNLLDVKKAAMNGANNGAKKTKQ